MKKLILTTLLSVATLFSGFTQNVDFDKKNFSSNKDGLKTALNELSTGNFHYMNHVYSQALSSFEKAQNFNPKNAELNAKIADCYFHTGETAKAKTQLEQAFKLDASIDGYFTYLKAQMAQAENNFDEAIKLYRTSKTKGSSIRPEAIATVDKKIKECGIGKKLIETPINVEIVNVGSAINSSNQ